MSRVVEPSGAQVLPMFENSAKRTIAPWLAVLACSADRRARYPEFMNLARYLVVKK